MAQPIEAEWPDSMRLPVAGDSVSVDWATGRVQYVAFTLDEGEWDVRIKLA